MLASGGAVATRKRPASKRAAKGGRSPKVSARAAPPPRQPLSHPVKQLAARDAPLVERLRKICLSFPETGERLSHGEPTWFAGKGKVFAMLDNHHHGAPHLGVWLPQPRGVQESLLATEPQRFFRPPYVGASGWVGMVLDTRPNWERVEQLVRE